MRGHDGWDDLAEAALTHDLDRERLAWRELTCVVCGDPVLPGEVQCCDHFVAAAHRRDDAERAAILARPRPPYRRWFGQAAS